MSYIKRLPGLAILGTALGLILLLGYSATAFAANAATPADSSSLLDLLKPVYEAFAGGHYAYAAALGVIVLCALVKRYGLPGVSDAKLHSDPGGALLALAMGLATGAAAGLAAPGAHVTYALLKSSLLVGVGAAGGFAVLKHLFAEPILRKLQAKAPAWAQPLFGLVLWIFDKPDFAAEAQASAAAAGAAAVTAHPAQGLDATTGTATEVK